MQSEFTSELAAKQYCFCARCEAPVEDVRTLYDVMTQEHITILRCHGQETEFRLGKKAFSTASRIGMKKTYFFQEQKKIDSTKR
jgi:hypothetical protein